MTAVEGSRFLIPSLCSDCGGRIFSFASQEDLDKIKNYYVEAQKFTAALFSWVFVKDNILVQINGELDEDKARQYEVVLTAMQIGVTTVILVTPTPLIPTSIPTLFVVNPQDARASSFIEGNGSPNFPAGEPGKISVIVSGKIGEYTGALPIIVRNNTQFDVIRIQVTSVAYSQDGKMLATGGTQGMTPNYVRPGEITMGFVYFGNVKIPDDARYEFDLSEEKADSDAASYDSTRDLIVEQANNVDGRIVGMLENQYEYAITGPMQVRVFCFDENNSLLGFSQGYTNKDKAEPKEKIPFQVEMMLEMVGYPCPIYLVAGSGYPK